MDHILLFVYLSFVMRKEEIDTKGVIRIRKSKKDIQHNDQRKKDKQRTTKYYT